MLHDYYSLYVVYAMFYENKFIVIVIVIVIVIYCSQSILD